MFQLVLVALTSLITIIFLSLLGDCSETLVLLQGLFRFLKDAIADFQSLSFFNNVALPVLLSLNLDHVIVFGAIALFLSLQLLLTFIPLVVEVHLEGLL